MNFKIIFFTLFSVLIVLIIYQISLILPKSNSKKYTYLFRFVTFTILKIVFLACIKLFLKKKNKNYLDTSKKLKIKKEK